MTMDTEFGVTRATVLPLPYLTSTDHLKVIVTYAHCGICSIHPFHVYVIDHMIQL